MSDIGRRATLGLRKGGLFFYVTSEADERHPTSHPAFDVG